MANSLGEFFLHLGMEPPLRSVVRTVLKYMSISVKTRALWDVSQKPAYLLGVVTAAEQALRQGAPEISVIEFGVAGGTGLVILQNEAEAVERETGIKIKVYGFDLGTGLPSLIGDYRDHPEGWREGDFPMDEAALRAQLTNRTTLILGNVQDTIVDFYQKFQPPPVGFVSIDLDLYSSTRDALQVFTLPNKRMLRHVPIYFDDIEFLWDHKFAGELLAIEEFNQINRQVKIDRWYGVRASRPFPERQWLEKMYAAHDLQAISQVVLDRQRVAKLPLLE